MQPLTLAGPSSMDETRRVRTVRTPNSDDVDRAVKTVAAHLPVTPVVASPSLGEDVALKLETLQPTGSFKVRGGLCAVAKALEADRSCHVVAASAGNHGLGVAFAASRLGADATVVVPVNASEVKVAALMRFPVNLVRHGTSYDEAEAHAMSLADRGARYISPYNDPDVIAGQATVGVELLRQLPDLAMVVAPVGGGGLVSGLCIVLAASRGIEVLGVEVAESPTMQKALEAGHAVPLELPPTLADGLAGNLEPGSVTIELARRYLSGVVTVSEDEIEEAIRFLASEHGLIVEGSGAVVAAAFLKGRIQPKGKVAGVLTGRNIAPASFLEVLAKG